MPGAPTDDIDPPDQAPPQNVILERYKATLDFWKFVLVSGFAAIVIAVAPAAFQFVTKSRELARTITTSHESNIQSYLDKAVNQDIEVRIRFATYFVNVSDPVYKKGWENYLQSLEYIRKDIRKTINEKEQELYQMQAANDKNITVMFQLKRELQWAYGELGYAQPDANITKPKEVSFSKCHFGVYTVKSIPAAMVAQTVLAFGLDNPEKIDKIDNHDGTFDVVATCADDKPSSGANK